jgi:ATP synthase F1 delta subunit
MENLTVNSVYGQGLFEAVEDAGISEQVCDCIGELECIFKENSDLFDLFRVPTIDANERKNIAKELFSGKIPAELLNFLYVLIDKRRMESFFGIARVYEKLVDEQNGVTCGRLVTATEIDDAQLAKLEGEAGKLLHKNVRLMDETDPSLLGGCRIYIDGKIIDASLKTKLDKLKEKIV